jgi:hypothetical protein
MQRIKRHACQQPLCGHPEAEPLRRFALPLRLLCCAAVAIAASPVFAQALYGVISSGTNQGYLVSINPTNGAATPIGDTGLTMPGGLTYDPVSGTLYAIDTFGGGEVYSVNPTTGVATTLSGAGNVPVPGALAYRSAESRFYTNFPGTSTNLIYRLDKATGLIFDYIGVVNKGGMGGMAVRSDGVVFGTGPTSVTGPEMLFRIATTPGPPPRETDVGSTGAMIRGLSFHPTTGVLYGSTGSSLVTIDTSTGATTTIGPFGAGIGVVAGISFASAPSSTNVDVWIRDCSADTGNTPTNPAPCPQYYTSPDIWIDNNNDMVIDAPVVGADNILKAVVRNRGPQVAHNVTVNFYYRDNTTGLVFPDGANLIGTDTVTVPGNGAVLASIIWTNLPPSPTTGGHWCIGVVLDHGQDPPISPTVAPYQDNNVGIANIWYLAGRAGDVATLSANAGTGGKSGFGLTPWPRQFRLEVVEHLPEGWEWSLNGLTVAEPFMLRLGEQRPFEVAVKLAPDAPPHSGGTLDVRQVDVATGAVVGGLYYELYEDHQPPTAVQALKSSIVDGHAVLTWEAVLTEAETLLPERVAFYELFKNGRSAGKITIDADECQPGMQWVDPEPLVHTTEYWLRVVDAGGNISADSPVLKVPGQSEEEPTENDRSRRLLALLLLILFLLLLWRAAPGFQK